MKGRSKKNWIVFAICILLSKRISDNIQQIFRLKKKTKDNLVKKNYILLFWKNVKLLEVTGITLS